MIRVTVKDAEQTISFVTNDETLRGLVAGCSADPANLGELLIASDIYRRGIAAKVMSDLIEFDKALRENGPDFVHGAISAAKTEEVPFEMAFQVIDDVTEHEAMQPRACKLLVIDLTERVISTSPGLDISASGEVDVTTGNGVAKPTVTYILPRKWKIQDQ